jgi:hypothetical protein
MCLARRQIVQLELKQRLLQGSKNDVQNKSKSCLFQSAKFKNNNGQQQI